MSKSTRLQSRRKWALGGVGLLLGIGLITTAGATWIIGANAGSTNNDVSVSVDTVQNKSVKLTTTLSDSSIKLGEAPDTSLSYSGIVGSEGADGDLSITFSEIKVEYGSSYVPDGGHLQLSFELKYGEDHTDNAQNLVDDEANLTGVHKEGKTVDSTGGGGTADSWTYVDIASPTINVPKSTSGSWEVATEAVNGVYTATGTDIAFNFKWGSFFGGMSPANYYNSKFQGGATTENAANIEMELKAMYKALNDKKLVLTATVSAVAGV